MTKYCHFSQETVETYNQKEPFRVYNPSLCLMQEIQNGSVLWLNNGKCQETPIFATKSQESHSIYGYSRNLIINTCKHGYSV